MNVARVTVAAMNHGLTAGFWVNTTPPVTNSADIHGWLNGHAGPQQMLSILIFIEANSHGEPLHYFHVIPGRIFRRKQAEERTSGTRQTLHFSFVVTAKGIHAKRHWLARSHTFELRLFEVCGDPDILDRNDQKQALPRLHAVAEFHGLTSNDAADWSVDLRIAEVELGGAQIGAGLLHVSSGRVRP